MASCNCFFMFYFILHFLFSGATICRNTLYSFQFSVLWRNIDPKKETVCFCVLYLITRLGKTGANCVMIAHVFFGSGSASFWIKQENSTECGVVAPKKVVSCKRRILASAGHNRNNRNNFLYDLIVLFQWLALCCNLYVLLNFIYVHETPLWNLNVYPPPQHKIPYTLA